MEIRCCDLVLDTSNITEDCPSLFGLKDDIFCTRGIETGASCYDCWISALLTYEEKKGVL